MTTIETESRLLICELTHQERQEAADRAAQAGAAADLALAEEQKHKDAAKGAKEHKEDQARRALDELKKFRTGQEERMVLCDVLCDPVTRQIVVHRRDTGAVVETRAADSDEVKEAQQQELPGVGGRGRRTKDKAEA